MTDADHMEFLTRDAHFMIGVDIHGNGPLPISEPGFDHYACACGVPYYPCPATPVTPDNLEAITTLLARVDEHSPGPWHVEPPVEVDSRPPDTYDVLDWDAAPVLLNTTHAQAQFVALSRVLVPRLVAQLQRANADLERTTNAMLVLTQAVAEHEARLYPEGEGDTEPAEIIGHWQPAADPTRYDRWRQ